MEEVPELLAQLYAQYPTVEIVEVEDYTKENVRPAE